MTQLDDEAALRKRLAELRTEHRDLDDILNRIALDVYVDQLQVRRLKKRKLWLKDTMDRIESELLPDILA